MHPVLASVHLRLQQALEPMSVQDMQIHPLGNQRRWNAQQIAEHLILTYRGTSTLLAERLGKKRRTKTRRTALQAWLQIMIIGLGYLPKGVPAPEATMPGLLPPASGNEMAGRLAEEAEKMDRLIDQCRQAFGLEHVATHVLLGPLRVDQWRRFHVLHGQHHLKQIAALKREMPMRVVPKSAAPDPTTPDPIAPDPTAPDIVYR